MMESVKRYNISLAITTILNIMIACLNRAYVDRTINKVIADVNFWMVLEYFPRDVCNLFRRISNDRFVVQAF